MPVCVLSSFSLEINRHEFCLHSINFVKVSLLTNRNVLLWFVAIFAATISWISLPHLILISGIIFPITELTSSKTYLNNVLLNLWIFPTQARDLLNKSVFNAFSGTNYEYATENIGKNFNGLRIPELFMSSCRSFFFLRKKKTANTALFLF